MFEYLQNVSVSGICPRSCRINAYSGKITYTEVVKDRFAIAYYYLPPATKEVAEEYLIYDFIGVIGAVGGTLGICIGFSIYGKNLLLQCLFIQRLIKIQFFRNS